MRALDVIQPPPIREGCKRFSTITRTHFSMLSSLCRPIECSQIASRMVAYWRGPRSWSGHLVTMDAAGYSNAFGSFQANHGAALQRVSVTYLLGRQYTGIHAPIRRSLLRTRSARWLLLYHVAITGPGPSANRSLCDFACLEILATSAKSRDFAGVSEADWFSPPKWLWWKHTSPPSAQLPCLAQAVAPRLAVSFSRSLHSSLLPRLGIGWTIRIMGSVFFANAIIAIALAKPKNCFEKQQAHQWRSTFPTTLGLVSSASQCSQWCLVFTLWVTPALSNYKDRLLLISRSPLSPEMFFWLPRVPHSRFCSPSTPSACLVDPSPLTFVTSILVRRTCSLSLWLRLAF